MKTEQEWLNIYHELWDMFTEGHNKVRLMLGQFAYDTNWGYIECLTYNKEDMKKVFVVADKYDLDVDFSGHYDVKLREKYKEAQAQPSEDVR